MVKINLISSFNHNFWETLAISGRSQQFNLFAKFSRNTGQNGFIVTSFFLVKINIIFTK